MNQHTQKVGCKFNHAFAVDDNHKTAERDESMEEH